MFSYLRFAFATLLLLLVSACGDDNGSEPTPSSSANKTMTTSPEVSAVEGISAGMSEDEVHGLLGKPDVTTSRTIDDLTVTHCEWHADDGISSVQFQNGKAQHSQFMAKMN